MLDHYLRTVPIDQAAALQLVVATSAAYFGEVVRQLLGGRWEAGGPEAEWRVVLPTGLNFSPAGFVATAVARADLDDADSEIAAPPRMLTYLQAALASFSPEVPHGWAYTLRTESDGRETVERFDPATPADGQWTLLRTNGHAPTPEELAKYTKFKGGQTTSAAQATFRKDDVDPGSLTLVSEDARRADYNCAFREQSASSDKMLAHLVLRLRISKQPAHVEKYTLELREPYSPVLGVKMHELVVDLMYSPPAAGRPSLPWRSTSHFRGRMFVVPVEENLRLTYSDFVDTP